MSKFLITISLILISINLSSAQGYEYGVYNSEYGDLNYRILYPENFDSNQKYPVILFLHGAGERGSKNEKQLVHGSKLFLSSDFRENYPSVVIFPQCPVADYWSNATVDRKTKPIGFEFNSNKPPTIAMNSVMSLIDSIQSLEYSIDDQFYLGGLSMGGLGTYELLMRKPEMFVAAFAICGGGDPTQITKYVNTALWVFHGSKDDVVHPSLSTAMVLAMQKAGGEVRYNLYPEANHNSWDSAFAEDELIAWLFSHKKTSSE